MLGPGVAVDVFSCRVRWYSMKFVYSLCSNLCSRMSARCLFLSIVLSLPDASSSLCLLGFAGAWLSSSSFSDSVCSLRLRVIFSGCPFALFWVVVRSMMICRCFCCASSIWICCGRTWSYLHGLRAQNPRMKLWQCLSIGVWLWHWNGWLQLLGRSSPPPPVN